VHASFLYPRDYRLLSGYETAQNRAERGRGCLAGKNAFGMKAGSVVEGLATYAIGLGFSHFATEWARRELRMTRAGRIAKQLYAP
jgi:hypothetical protein